MIARFDSLLQWNQTVENSITIMSLKLFILKISVISLQFTNILNLQSITIDLHEWCDIKTIIRDLNQIDPSHKSIEINIDYKEDSYIDCSVYPVICSFVSELRENGNDVIVNFKTDLNCDNLRYASRINFLKEIGIEYNESFDRHQASGRFIEITNLSGAGVYGHPDNFLDIFDNEFNLKEEETDAVSILFNELICNTTIHSSSLSGCFTYAQKYPSKNKLDIILCDSGVGLRESLIDSHPSITEKEAIRRCIESGFGNGKGQGQGLFMASQLAKLNGGSFEIYSGEWSLSLDGQGPNIQRIPKWQGVIAKIVLDLNNTMPTLSSAM